jgi:hypothetical protein
MENLMGNSNEDPAAGSNSHVAGEGLPVEVNHLLSVAQSGSRGSIMVWGAIAKGKKYPLVRVEYYDKDGNRTYNPALRHPDDTGIPDDWEHRRKTISGPLYSEQILIHRLSRWMADFISERGPVQAVEDNAPVHNSVYTSEVRDSLGIGRIPHPPRSPDLNPIEHVWAIVKERVRKRKERPTTVDELWVAMRDEWDAVPQETIDRIIDSMPARLHAVIEAKGWHTRY